MRNYVLTALAAVSAISMVPAAYAADFGPGSMNLVPAADGSISATFGNSGIVAGNFTDVFHFTILANGTFSGSIVTNANELGSSTDLDFISAFFNGTQLTGFTGSLSEALFANNVTVVGGVENLITINGLSRGNGSYGGQGVFTPVSAVPEPATWAMMLLGFGVVGYAMRRRKVSFNNLQLA